MDQEQEDGQEVVLRDVLNSRERESRRLANKPYIDHLDNAIEIQNGKPVFLQGREMRVIIERVASCLVGSPWLDTRSYIVKDINTETGDLRLLDEELMHMACSNFITGPALGYRFKIPAKKGAVLPRRNKTDVKPRVEETKAKPVAEASGKERRIYSTKGILHTRIKGLAYVPQGESKAADGMRLMTVTVGTNLKVSNTELGWEEVWTPNKEI